MTTENGQNTNNSTSYVAETNLEEVYQISLEAFENTIEVLGNGIRGL